MGLHFLPAGQELGAPVSVDEALCRVVFGQASADYSVLVNPTSEEFVIAAPWKTPAEGQRKLREFMHASVAIHDALRTGRLSVYVEVPSRAVFVRVDRLYWLQQEPCGPYVLKKVENATGWDPSMTGQPLLVRVGDLPEWESVAGEALAALPDELSPAPPEKVRRATKPKPYWYPMLRELVEGEDRRLAEWVLSHPGKIAPAFPKLPAFRRRLIARGVKEDDLPRSTVDYHLRALKDELGR